MRALSQKPVSRLVMVDCLATKNERIKQGRKITDPLTQQHGPRAWSRKDSQLSPQAFTFFRCASMAVLADDRRLVDAFFSIVSIPSRRFFVHFTESHRVKYFLYKLGINSFFNFFEVLCSTSLGLWSLRSIALSETWDIFRKIVPHI